VYHHQAVPLSNTPSSPASDAPIESGLTAPTLLIAMPQVLDPFFHKSVVLMIHHDDDEGSFGLIINRRTDARLSEILEGLEITWQGDEDERAFFGGPVQPQLGTVLFPAASAGRSADETLTDLDGASECALGVAMTHHVGDLSKLAEEQRGGLRLFLGYAGWGSGQLVQEILRDDWLVAPVRLDLVFSEAPDRVWEEALLSVGVDPASLPSWSTRDEDDEQPTN